jgi:hypothetical protein
VCFLKLRISSSRFNFKNGRSKDTFPISLFHPLNLRDYNPFLSEYLNKSNTIVRKENNLFYRFTGLV